MIRPLRFLWLVLFLAPLADAQQAANEADELRFVESMRKQGYPDLALQYLDTLKKKPTVSEDFKKEIPVEIAKTQLEMAGDEPDITRRLALIGDVRAELQKYLKANPTSRRAAEIELDIVKVAGLQGRLTLSQAIMLDENDAFESPERLKARTLLKEAGKELAVLDKKLKDQVKALPETKTPDEKAARDRLERTSIQTQFDIAMNYFDQALTYPRNHRENKVLLERNKRLEECNKELAPLAALDGTSPVTGPIKWRSLAWLGRCLHEQGDPNEARKAFAQVIDIGGRFPLAGEGVRLAQYFRLLVIDEKADAGEDRSKLLAEGTDRWLRTYPRLQNTPEGCGIRWLQAKNTFERAAVATDAKAKANLLLQTRRILTSLEATENDFTDRARRKKIGIIGQQGAFTKKVSELTSFEDCYVRVQYEQYEMEKDADKLKGTELDGKRKERTETIMAALTAGLGKPDAKSKQFLTEANNARTMLCYYNLNEKKYEECIKFGETFAREDPRSGQAVKCAAYALQSYAMLSAQGKGEPAKMLDFAKYCKDRWGKELPGDLARHQLAIAYLSEKKQDEATKELEELTANYPAYAATQLLLATELGKMLQAEPDRAAELRKRMLAALERIPETAKGTAEANQMYYLARCKLADEMYNGKQYDRMETIAAGLEKELGTTKFHENEAKDKEMRGYFDSRLGMIHAYSSYGRAKASMDKSDFAAVTKQLDPLVDRVLDKKFDALKSNLNLANAIFDMALKANIQQGNIDRTTKTVQALQTLSEDAGGDVPPLLRQLVPLIRLQFEDLQKKGNQAALEKARTGFSGILDELTRKQAKVNPEFQITLAQAYSGMLLHLKAAELLRKIEAPDNYLAKERAGDRDVQVYKAAQVMIVKALRQEKLYDEANKAMTAIMGENNKTGWGLKSIDALKEKINLCIDTEEYNTAFSIASQVAGALAKRIDDPRMKEQYIDVYYNMVFSLARQAARQKTEANKKRGMDEAARHIVELEKRIPDLGGEISEKRFRDMVAGDPDLKSAYDAQTKK